jgi:amidase
MHTFPWILALPCVVLSCTPARAAGPTVAVPRVSPAGEWELDELYFGHTFASRMQLEVAGESLSGWVYEGHREPLKGTLKGGDVSLELTGDDGTVATYTGHIAGDRMSGTVYVKAKRPEDTATVPWTAKRFPAGRPPAARTIDFEPTKFEREFSARVPPVLRVWPGDAVRTRSVDAAGIDEKGVRRVLGGNPLTGPFYVEGAMPGDVLAVTITRLRLNRDTAVSGNGFVSRAMTPDYARDAKDPGEGAVYWRLDRQRGVATLETPSEPLKAFSVPVKPMLGCVGVAPHPAGAPLPTQDSGSIGGNMDFNLVTEGTTVYLTVNAPGALLYVGDGHAVQGDGELTGSALETSLDIELRTDVIREKWFRAPRLENADYLMAMGLEGSLDDALRSATTELARWLQEDYALSAGDASLVLGTSVGYAISEVADRNVGVVAKIPKTAVASLKRAHPGTK